ncbi:N-acetylmuramoyl-L-alanine amidase [Nocardioides sp. KR10-350]|uniref:N-acetylmuramoyl-L-alanine amidase n=1 Tax=Nocardioides cheoyonin TaxID=3156615 RepID=UPI0032B3DFB0
MSLRVLSKRSGAGLVAAGALAAGALYAVPLASAPAAGSSVPTTDWAACLSGTTDRQAVFERAAATSGVPSDVLLAVSYMESRWDVHGSSPSTSGGYGPMNLTDIPALTAGADGTPDDELGKGDPSAPHVATGVKAQAAGNDGLATLRTAHQLTGISVKALRSDAVANICGGAAVLASYQKQAGGAADLGDWSAAVARYSGASDEATALRFVTQVFTTLRTGAARTTNDGQRVSLAARPAAVADRSAVADLGLTAAADDQAVCPASLGCEWIPAPYENYDTSDPGAYGNYDLADRPTTMKIDYIVLHDTEETYDNTIKLVQDPTYLGWHYTLRSSDGHAAAHIDPKNVGWHAGNWYVNSHSIGVEQEGFAAEGATWFTEALYQTSSTLVRYLAAKYDIPLDRAHIIGHDQVPGIAPANVATMHWDPGPYWDWKHYFDLLKAPIKPDRRGKSNVWTVRPDFATNHQTVTSCETAGDTCPEQGSNFVYLHTEPSEDAPLLPDAGLHTDGSSSTTGVSDWGARVDAGQKVVVAKKQGDWWAVWFSGQLGWLHDPDKVLIPSQGTVVTPKGDTAVAVYGRALPEESAYTDGIPYQKPTPLQYTIEPGQAYVLADKDIETDYYKAWNYNCQTLDDGVPDCVDVKGRTKYYEIWYNHRVAYVKADDVTLAKG